MSDSIWATLSKIDCSEHVEKKGKFSYLAWTWAWAMVKERYPYAEYRLVDDTVYPDGTMEVRVEVSVPTQFDAGNHKLVFNTLTHTMWLPVLNHQNKAIANPNAFDINTSRMRCLVKCLAMFGLGHYIYAGESTPQEETYSPEQLAHFNMLVASEDGWGMIKYFNEIGESIRDSLFNSAPQGEKTALKTKCRDMVGQANRERKAYVKAIQEALAAKELSSIEECLSELTEVELPLVMAGLSEIEKVGIDQLRSEA